MFDTLAQVNVANIFNDLIHMRMSAQVLSTCIVFSAIGAIILAKFTGSFGSVTFPLNFIALFVGTFVTNCLLDGIDIPSIQYQQEVLVFTIAGMVSSSFAIMWAAGAKNY